MTQNCFKKGSFLIPALRVDETFVTPVHFHIYELDSVSRLQQLIPSDVAGTN